MPMIEIWRTRLIRFGTVRNTGRAIDSATATATSATIKPTRDLRIGSIRHRELEGLFLRWPPRIQFRLEPAAAHHQDPIAEREDLGHLGRDHHDRLPRS